MDTVGYTLLNGDQYSVLYGRDGMYNATETNVNVPYWSSLSEQQKQRQLDGEIRRLARTTDESETVL